MLIKDLLSQPRLTVVNERVLLVNTESDNYGFFMLKDRQGNFYLPINKNGVGITRQVAINLFGINLQRKIPDYLIGEINDYKQFKEEYYAHN